MTAAHGTAGPAGPPVLADPGDAPKPPGRLGVPVDVADARAYLEALTGWRDRLRATLDDLDARAGAGGGDPAPGAPARVAEDLTLALVMWKAVSERTDEMVRLYDNGRMGRTEAEQLSLLIWGRFDGTAIGGGLPVTFSEACTLASSVTATLAAALDAADVVGASRARVRAVARTLPRRLRAASDRAAAVHALAQRCTDKIARAPRLGIPDPGALGAPPAPAGPPAPDADAAVLAFDARLALVEAALAQAAARYQAPLTERDDLRGLLQSYQAKAAALGVAEHPPLRAAYESARRALWSAPCDLAAARALTSAYAALVPGGAAQPKTEDR